MKRLWQIQVKYCSRFNWLIANLFCQICFKIIKEQNNFQANIFKMYC